MRWNSRAMLGVAVAALLLGTFACSPSKEGPLVSPQPTPETQTPTKTRASTQTQTPKEADSPSAPSVWVAPNGSDSAAGTREAPLRTPQAALDQLDAAGGTVVLRGGTYSKQRIVIKDRRDVTVRAAEGEKPMLDHTGAPPPKGVTGVIEVRDGSNVAIEGLTITGYRTRSLVSTPIGIHASGATSGLRIENNHVHHLGNDNPTRGSFDINAHGIAVYGTSAKKATTGVVIRGNEVDHLALGASEAVVVNGNVDGFEISKNSIHDVNNIAIDAIGFEETISGAARWTDVNRASAARRAGPMSTAPATAASRATRCAGCAPRATRPTGRTANGATARAASTSTAPGTHSSPTTKSMEPISASRSLRSGQEEAQMASRFRKTR